MVRLLPLRFACSNHWFALLFGLDRVGSIHFRASRICGRVLRTAFRRNFLGRLGDLVGRKYTFLITIFIMGLSAFAVGILRSYNSIGIVAPVLLIGLRLLQGLALGGEYGGAAIYVAEPAERDRRGYRTSWIQTFGFASASTSAGLISCIRLSLRQ